MHDCPISLTVDCVIFGYDSHRRELKALLIQRKNPPYQDYWALPGGFVEKEEALEEAALRELEEETSVKNVFIEQLYTFGNPRRDPRGRVVSVAYFALVNLEEHPIHADSDAQQAAWFRIDQLPPLAFDHADIVQMAITRLRNKVRYQPIGFELLPEQFTLGQLQALYETVLGLPLNKRNFRTRILKLHILEEVGKQQGVAHRPATLYRFNKEKYHALERENYPNLLKRGLDFEI